MTLLPPLSSNSTPLPVLVPARLLTADVLAVSRGVATHDPARAVYPVGTGTERAGRVKRGVAAMIEQEAVRIVGSIPRFGRRRLSRWQRYTSSSRARRAWCSCHYRV